GKIRDSRIMTAIARAYARTIGWLVRRAGRVVVLAGLATVLAIVALGRAVGTEFLPQLDEGSIWIRCNLPPGISLYKSAEVASAIRRLVAESPEVRLVSSQTGRNDSGTDPYGPNRNEFLVDLQPYETWPKGKVKRDLVEELATRLRAAIPGGTF